MFAIDRRLGGRAAPAVLGLLALALLGSAAIAGDRGSPADQDACTPDVFRLCSDLIPDETQIVACLESKRAQLSPACGRVFAPATDKLRRRRRHAAPV